jgi:cysteinyl-tRNA synthetase
MHNGLVTVGGQKMSKSLGNGVSVEEFFEQGSPAAVRYWLGSAQYRSTLDYSPASIAEAEAAVSRILGFIERSGVTQAGSVPVEFAEAMDNDFNVPAALAVLHDTVRAGNSGDETAAPKVLAMAEILGIRANRAEASAELATKVEQLLAERKEARANKDFARSDAIRDELNQLGVTIEDTANGTTWSLNG